MREGWGNSEVRDKTGRKECEAVKLKIKAGNDAMLSEAMSSEQCRLRSHWFFQNQLEDVEVSGDVRGRSYVLRT